MNLRRRVLWIAALMACAGYLTPYAVGNDETPASNASASDADETPDAKVESPAQTAMAQMAKQCVFQPVAQEGKERDPLILRPDPLIRYGDATRDIGSSALWVWMDDEIPAMFQKIEVNTHQGSNNKWTWCFANSSSEKIQCSWPEVRKVSPTVEPVMAHAVPGIPEIKATPAAMALAARQLSRQFTARDGKDELRLMPRPLMEFASEKREIPYGAVFGFATGTNPSMLLILQVEMGDKGQRWVYRPVHMTSWNVVLDYDGKTVWQEAGQQAHDVSSWGYYFSFREASIK